MAAQRIKQRLDFNADDPQIGTFAIRAFEFVDRFFLVAKAEVDQRKGKRSDMSMRGQQLELREKITRFLLLISFRISLCQHRQDYRIVRDLSRFLVFGHCFAQLSAQLECFAERPARVIKTRIHCERFAQLVDRLVVAPRQQKVLAKVGIDDEGEWIEFHRAHSFRDGAIEFAYHCKIHVAELMMRGGVIGI